MPLRANIDETKLPKMAVSATTEAKPKTGIKVIIVGAGTLTINPLSTIPIDTST
jgi:hypothetical protein